MNSFAFVVHPLEVGDILRKYMWAKIVPPRWLERAISLTKPQVVSHISGIRSPTGAEAHGWFVGLPLTASLLLQMEPQRATQRIIEACRLAESLGAGIVGLGAYTSIVGDAGVTVAASVGIPVTTGNSYTVATALEALGLAAEKMEVEMSQATAAVVGATGSLGRTCARNLSRRTAALNLVGRDLARTEALAEEIRAAPECRAEVRTYKEISAALREAELVISVSSAVEAIIGPQDLRPGAVICDPARPRDVSHAVARERDDVLVVDGGVVEVPGEVEFGFDFGFPPGTAYACMAETMVLALEGRYESFSLGRDLSEAKVAEIAALARKHGFRLAGFRAFERAVTEEAIARVKARAREALRSWRPAPLPASRQASRA